MLHSNNKKFIKITLLNILVLICLSMVHPVTPKLINTLNLPSFYFGLLYGCLYLATFLSSPTFGGICDKFGYKKPMIISIIGYIIGQFIFGFLSNSITILIARLISGIFVAGYYVSSLAYVSRITEEHNKLRNFSYFNASTSLGSAIGSLLGGYIGVTNFQNTFIVQQIICYITLIFIIVLFKDNATPNNKSIKFKVKFFNIQDFNHIIKNYKFLSILLILIVITFFGIQGYTSTISYYIEDILSLPTTVNGLVLASTGIFTIFTNLFLNPYLNKKVRATSLYSYTVLISGISLIISMVSNNNLYILSFLLIFIIAHTLIVPIMQTMIMNNAQHNQGEIMGLQHGFKSIGLFLGSISSGFIFDIWFKLPFILSGISLIICFILITYYSIQKHKKAIIN